MLNFWVKLIRRKSHRVQYSLARTYQTVSSASIDDLWQKVINLADVSWHPLLISTNVPYGLVAKPGLIYQAVTRWMPIPVRIFVEQVCPRELLSIRVLVIPGLEERVTYQMGTTDGGTWVAYSVNLQGWLSPFIWSFLQPYAARVASELAQAVEQAVSGELPAAKSSPWSL